MTDTHLTVGRTAPDFSLPRDGGGTVSLAEFKGKYLVLYFYPKDDTSGCTKQGIAFTDHLAAFHLADAEIVGVSKDSVAKHDKFRDKHGLGVILASDEGSDTCERYGVWKEKSMYGKTYMGIERSTFLIGPDGEIVEAWHKARVPGHVEAVLEAVQNAAA